MGKSNAIQMLFLAVASAAFLGCFGKKSADRVADSEFSDVNVATPTLKDLQRPYGANCEKVKLSPKSLAKVGGKSGCEALLALTNGYRLTIEGGACQNSGIRATNVAATTGKLNNQSISTKLKRNCDYSVKLELGLDDVYYFDNRATWRGNLPQSKVSGPTATLQVRLRPTGVEGGIPPGEISPTGLTDIKIKIRFANPTNEAGAPTPNPSTPSASPVFQVPAGWTGTSFQGDGLYQLSRSSRI